MSRIEPGVEAPAPAPRGPVNRRAYLLVAGSLVVVAVAAVLFAAHTNPLSIQPEVDVAHLPVGPLAPAVNGDGWTNSGPLAPADLKDKVVLYDFWTYSCINCVRTIPYLRSWYDRYRSDGLVIIGIHSPEFDFEMNHANVLRAITNLGVTWPVAFDDKMAVWDAFNNDNWPTDYVADRNGHLRYEHIGEGDYSQTEDVLRSLLGVAASSPRAAAPAATPANTTAPAPTAGSGDVTPETYLGVLHGDTAALGPGNYPDPGVAVPVDTAKLSGSWTGTAEYLEADSSGSAIVLHYQASEVNLVMAPPVSGPVTVVIELDGKPLPAAYRTSQIIVDASGQTSLVVDHPDMYTLVLGSAIEGHVVRVTSEAAGLMAYDFTFEP